jgi:hypothetical protein
MIHSNTIVLAEMARFLPHIDDRPGSSGWNIDPHHIKRSATIYKPIGPLSGHYTTGCNRLVFDVACESHLFVRCVYFSLHGVNGVRNDAKHLSDLSTQQVRNSGILNFVGLNRVLCGVQVGTRLERARLTFPKICRSTKLRHVGCCSVHRIDSSDSIEYAVRGCFHSTV